MRGAKLAIQLGNRRALQVFPGIEHFVELLASVLGGLELGGGWGGVGHAGLRVERCDLAGDIVEAGRILLDCRGRDVAWGLRSLGWFGLLGLLGWRSGWCGALVFGLRFAAEQRLQLLVELLDRRLLGWGRRLRQLGEL